MFLFQYISIYFNLIIYIFQLNETKPCKEKKNPPPKVRTGSKQVNGVSNHRTTFGPPGTFLTSPSLGHHVLSTVSPGMKQRVSPGSIDNGFGYGFGFDLPDDISDLDGLAKIGQPNLTNSASSVYFDHQFCSPSLPTVIPHISVTSHWRGPARTCFFFNTPRRCAIPRNSPKFF
jgi:hypothetical protein